MKYAIIKLGGRQFMVHEGDVLTLERQEENVKPEVILFSDDGAVTTGADLKDIKIKLETVEEKRGRKVRIGKFLAKSTYRKIIGHRQPLSVIKVSKLGAKGAVEEAHEEPKAKAVVKEEKKTVKKSEKAEKAPTKKPTAAKSSKKLSK